MTKPGTFLKRQQRIFQITWRRQKRLGLQQPYLWGHCRGDEGGGGEGVAGAGAFVVRTTEKILATPLIKARFIRITQLALNLEKRDAEEFGGSYRASNKDFTFA